MDINDMTIGQFRELSAIFGNPGTGPSHSLKVGAKYLIRTVTYHFLGEVKSVTDSDIVLDNSSWLASSGRFGAALKFGDVDEVEYVGDGHIIGRGGVIDICPWKHNLPKASK